MRPRIYSAVPVPSPPWETGVVNEGLLLAQSSSPSRCSCSPCLCCNASVFPLALITKHRGLVLFSFVSAKVLGLDTLVCTVSLAFGVLCLVLTVCFTLAGNGWEWLHVAAALCLNNLDDLVSCFLSAAAAFLHPQPGFPHPLQFHGVGEVF